jgi:serine/threonine protein kinase
MIAIGSIVSGYRVERVLGAGGMGTVYLAQNPELPRRDALKVLSARRGQAATPEYRLDLQPRRDRRATALDRDAICRRH